MQQRQYKPTEAPKRTLRHYIGILLLDTHTRSGAQELQHKLGMVPNGSFDLQ